jgi:hypothetical protein
MKRVRVTKERLYLEERKKKSSENHERGTRQLEIMENQKGDRIN